MATLIFYYCLCLLSPDITQLSSYNRDHKAFKASYAYSLVIYRKFVKISCVLNFLMLVHIIIF